MSPFLFQRSTEDRLAGPPVPVLGVEGVAFLPVKVGVDPRAVTVVSGLGDLVRTMPVIAGSTLQCTQRRRKIARIGLQQGMTHVPGMRRAVSEVPQTPVSERFVL
jgi:hypothetical protein